MKVIIVGGVAAGMSAAAKLKRANKEAQITVYEKSRHVSFGACGLPYFVGNFFEDSQKMIARTVEQFNASGITVNIEHEVLNVDTDNKCITVKNLLTGETFTDTYDKLMIATGASAIIPPIKNVDLKHVYTLKSMEDGEALKHAMQNEALKRVAIVGAGFIGLEVVEAAKQYRKEVHVFQLNDRVLVDTFDKEITDLLEEELRAHDVHLHLSQTVTELVGDEAVTQIKTNDETFDVDIVVLTAGVRPNTSFLKGTGIEMLRNGALVIDHEGRTSIEDIYAAGDCASINHILKSEPAYIPLATVANKMGRIIGENLAGAHHTFNGSLASACLKVMNLEAGRTGLSEQEAINLGINYKTVFITDMNQTSYYPGQSKINVKLIYNADTKVILGGQIVGRKDAVQRVNVLATAIFAGLTTDQLAMLDLCYAPPFARTWDVLNIAGSVAK
ncbi:CoA-disulfide reductase [Turicibacter sp. H121]|uniref:CoA-disulfide reductase n=1 Tax=Turicibacter sp. H121 TaxID=1712675 RepID=UPI0007630887|nr:CoA-disulfide reductase [Turicibacter sp. H121]AMC07916.1 CoA-disulfide reductase [Turicibacter sp. H121]MCU7198510.1 CoA-disulfide reductase [Turicibacter sp. H121]